MIRALLYLIILFPSTVLAQSTIRGRVLNHEDKKPVTNASVFLSNATIGDKTSADGTFALSHVKAGKYELIVSIIGFGTHRQDIIVNDNNISLPDIEIVPRAIALKEVNIKFKTDPNRQRYLEWFRDNFVGTSELAHNCHILNPEVLSLDYDDTKKVLTASSYDFVEVENPALGYRIKYLVNNFILDNSDNYVKKIHFDGFVLFEELKGTEQDKQRWQKARQAVYDNSSMHFLRAALADKLPEEGFRVLQYASYPNPKRPPDSLITAKIEQYKKLRSEDKNYNDSLSFWVKRSKLPKTFHKVFDFPLNGQDIVTRTDKEGIYALGCGEDALHITFSSNHHYSAEVQVRNLYNARNKDATLISFNAPVAYFDRNGELTDPASVTFSGAWSKLRVAELLPSDYVPPANQAAAPVIANAAPGISGKIQAYIAANPSEKAYLQFDKPFYAAGDTLYFKAYVTSGERHQPSTISGVLHVDLVGPDNKLSQHIALQLDSGIAWGDFTLPDTLAAGNYRVRAYTNWMRNTGNEAFFEKMIPVGSLTQQAIPENAVPGIRSNNAPDIQFMPEGGELVAGLTSKIAFKAIGTYGTSIAVKGVVLDNENREITKLASIHLGMGYFYITPQQGKTYKARLIYADGSQNTLDLPQAAEKGITLSVNNDSLPKASVRIEANSAFFDENKHKEYNLLVWAGGKVIEVPCRLDSTVINLDILKRKLQTGITTITLFTSQNEPVAERLIYVQNFDRLNLGISGDKPAYNKREKVNITLNIKDRADNPVTGHFSVAVTDESVVPTDENSENTIESNLLLTSELKGYVEQPGYYFTDITDKKLHELDLVMLTHGYRRFEWKQLLSSKIDTPKFAPENALKINGIATNLGGKVLSNATVSLISPQGGPILSTKTDSNGNFTFRNIAFTDSAKFIIQAVNARGNNNTQVVYKSDYNDIPALLRPLHSLSSQADTGFQVYLQKAEKQQEQLNQLGIGKGRYLRGVQIMGRKPPKLQIRGQYGVASQVLNGKELHQGPLLIQLMSKLHHVRIGSNGAFSWHSTGKPMAIVIDGTEFDDLSSLRADNIKTIEVMDDATVVTPDHDGVLYITTKGGGWQPGDDGDLHKVRALKEVKIKGIKPNDNYQSSNLGGAGHGDQVVHANEIENMGGQLSDRLDGKLHGVTFVRSSGRTVPVLTMYHTSPMLVLVDGSTFDVSEKGQSFDDLDPQSIETIEVLRYANASIYGMGAGNGVLVITTKQGKGRDAKDIISTGFLPVTVPGFYKARGFYSPKYDTPAISSKPDLRTTIYWKPELVPDKDGNVSFDYYNADGQGTYRIVVEGIDEKGTLARQVYRYKVQ